MDPVDLVKRLGALGAALGEDFTDGGQHDCEEVLSAIMDRLHEDLVRAQLSAHVCACPDGTHGCWTDAPAGRTLDI